MSSWLGALLLSVLALVYFGFWDVVYLTTPEYEVAKSYVETSEDVRELVGEGATTHGLPTGWILRRRGEATFGLGVRGTRGNVRLRMEVLRVGEEWRVVDARYDSGLEDGEVVLRGADALRRSSLAFEVGYALYQRGRLREAVAELGRALEQDSLFVDAWFWRAKAYESQGEPTAAVADLERVLDLRPAHREAQRTLTQLGGGRP